MPANKKLISEEVNEEAVKATDTSAQITQDSDKDAASDSTAQSLDDLVGSADEETADNSASVA